MRILGIDPGLAIVGIGVIESSGPTDLRVVDWCTITTRAGLPLPARLCEIRTDMNALLDDICPDLAVIEQLFFATNVTTAIDVAHARGVIMQTVAERSVPLLEPTPMQLKQAMTGDGGADKRQMQTMLLHLLGLREIPKPDDAADALALASYGAMQQHSLRIFTEQG